MKDGAPDAEDPPPPRGELGRGDADDGSRRHVAQPVPVVVDAGPADGRGRRKQAVARHRLVELVAQSGGEGEGHGGVARRPGRVPAERPEVVGIPVEVRIVGAPTAGDHLQAVAHPARHHERPRDAGTGPDETWIVGHQPCRQDARRDGAVDLGLAKMAHRLGEAVAGGRPVLLCILPDRAVDEQQGGQPAEDRRALPPMDRRRLGRRIDRFRMERLRGQGRRTGQREDEETRQPPGPERGGAERGYRHGLPYDDAGMANPVGVLPSGVSFSGTHLLRLCR